MEFRTGDFIEATKGETVIRGRLTDDLEVKDSGWLVGDLEVLDFDVALLGRPVPPLPTVPGVYVRKTKNSADSPTDYAISELDKDGVWTIRDVGYVGVNALEYVTRWNREYGLIRLVPEQ